MTSKFVVLPMVLIVERDALMSVTGGAAAVVDGVDNDVGAKEVGGRVGVGPGPKVVGGREKLGGCAEFITQQVEGELHVEAAVFRMKPSSLDDAVSFRTGLKPPYRPVIQRLS